MLGNCILRYPIRSDGALNRGVFCESFLFFGQTHLLLDTATLAAVVHGQFLDDVISMMKAGLMTGNYSPQTPALHSHNLQGLREHLFTVIKIVGDQSNRNMRNPEVLERQLGRLLKDKAKVRKYHRQLCDLISFDDLVDRDVGRLGRADICDPHIAREVARFALRQKGIPNDEIRFSQLEILSLKDNRFAISTDIDFDRLRRFVPDDEKSTFGPKDLFPVISDVRFDIRTAAERNAAFIGNEKNQFITDMILRRSLGVNFDPNSTPRQVYDFISVATPSVQEVINSGERTPQEFLKLMEKAGPFRTWLGEQNPSADLVKEMLREKSHIDWLEKLPIKSLRFALFVGAGKFAEIWVPGASVVTEGIDAFVVERLAKRWRPHYFVENDLRGFLDKK